MSALDFGSDGLLQMMTHDQEIVGVAVGYWHITKPILYRLNVKPEHTSTPWDRAALEAAYAVDLRDGHVHLRSVVDEIRGLGLASLFNIVGGVENYLAAVVGSVIVPSNVAHHARKTAEAAAKRRRIVELTAELAALREMA